MSFDQSTHMVSTSINVEEITAIFFAIFGIKTGQVSKKEETSSIQKKKLRLGRNVNLPRLLCASCCSKTSPMYSHTNVPRKIASPALTPNPCESDNKRQHKKLFESHCEFIKRRIVATFFSVINTSNLTRTPFCNILFGQVLLHPHLSLHSKTKLPS